jgi:hypothetical protein
MKIITAVVNNPEFIEIQYHTLKKYCKNEYQFIVFNDAKDFPDFTNDGDIKIKNKIEEKCKELGINCINIPNGHHRKNKDAATRCADSMNFILNYQKQNPDKYLLLDSDMFPIDYFDIEKYSKYDSAIVIQTRKNNKIIYFWNGIYYFDFPKLKNIHKMNWNCSSNCDVGGMMQDWLKTRMLDKSFPESEEFILDNRKVYTKDMYFIRHLSSCSWGKEEIPETIKNNEKLVNFLVNDSRNINSKFFCEIYDNVFLHYRAGGNWRKEGLDLHKNLTNRLKEALL